MKLDKEKMIIGIIGGVGSGKSTVTNILKEKYNAFIINTDTIAHTLMEKDQTSYKLIVAHFGLSILDKKANIDRVKLGNIVYNDSEELKKLNSFTHPFVMAEVKKIIKEKANEDCKYICIETALPIEASLDDICDKIWFVYTPIEIRIDRLKNKRNYSDEKIRNIMSKQLSDEEYKIYASDLIINEGTEEELSSQIDKILKKYYKTTQWKERHGNFHGNM